MYVIYKVNNIPGVGGVHPRGIQTALARFGDWYLGDCPTEKIHNYKEFGFVAVPDNIVRGLRIIDSIVDENTGSPVENITNFILTPSDEIDVEDAKKFINNIDLKHITRAKIRELKDVEDDLVDLKKMTHMLITFIVDDWNNKSVTDKEKSKYMTVMNDLTNTISENLNSLTTIENDINKVEEIVELEVKIAKIVDDYYLSKKL